MLFLIPFTFGSHDTPFDMQAVRVVMSAQI
jgi:hypothetical protein